MDNRRVLIVDDDPGIRILLAACLRNQNLDLREARGGREALAEMRNHHPDLVLMDLMMPEVSGWDVLRERAADPALQSIPMIVVTANNDRQETATALDEQVSAVLWKPFDLSAVLAEVSKCLGPADLPAPLAA